MYTINDWIISIEQTIPLIIQDEPTKNNATILAALYIVLDKLQNISNQTKLDLQSLSQQTEIVNSPLQHLFGTDKKASDYIMIVDHELSDADNYYKKGNRIIAKSELLHANDFINQARPYAFTQIDQDQIKDLQAKYQLISTVIK